MPENSKSEQNRHFNKVHREISVAAREQGDDPGENVRLRLAMSRARAINMPEERIGRARQLGTGELEGPTYTERLFEGYSAAGVAVLVKAITDDVARTASELERLFEEHGGNLGDDGCVAWQFERRGVIEVRADAVDDPEAFLLEVIQMGGQELQEPGRAPGERPPCYRIYCAPQDMPEVDEAVVAANYPVYDASITYEPTQRVPLSPDDVRPFLAFFERLLRREDVSAVHANWSVAGAA